MNDERKVRKKPIMKITTSYYCPYCGVKLPMEAKGYNCYCGQQLNWYDVMKDGVEGKIVE